MKSYDAGPTDVPVLEETIGANFDPAVVAHAEVAHRMGEQRSSRNQQKREKFEAPVLMLQRSTNSSAHSSDCEFTDLHRG